MLRVAALLLLLCLPVGSDVPSAANSFADAYNRWIELNKIRPSGLVVDAREIRAWHETQEKWKLLSRTVKYNTLPTNVIP